MAMTRASSAAASEACTSWSPSHLANETKIPRRYLQPPSDQRKLLDRPNAWFVNGLPNVPPSVLEDVREQHVKKPRVHSRTKRETLSSRPVSPAPAEKKEAFSSQPASPARSTASPVEPKEPSDETKESSDEEEETPGTPIPWTQSPPRHTHGPCQKEEEKPDITTSTTNRQLSVQRNPATIDNNLSRARYLTEFPPSDSAASEPGLEVKVPKAVTEVLAPVNREPVAALEPTPPSAQIIPCTIIEKADLAQAPQVKRPRRWKAPGYSSPGPVEQKHTLGLPVSTTRTAASSLPSSPVGSSPPPALPLLPHQPAETFSVVPSTGGQPIPTPANRQEVVAVTPQLVVTNQGSSNSTDKPPPNGPASQVPYTAFIVAYPDYRGSLGTFIRGAMCILPLQKDRALPEFLYDDFIRVFSTGFLQYIGSLDKDTRPLSAIQFYNENVSRPLYTKGVLTKDNINDVPEKYPEESRAIQQTLQKSEARRRPKRQVSDKMAADKHMVPLPPTPTDTSQPLPQDRPPSAALVTNYDAVTREPSPHMVHIHPAVQIPPLPERRGTDAPVTASRNVSGTSSVRRHRAQTELSATMPATSPGGLEVLRTQVDSSPPHTRPSPPSLHTRPSLPPPHTTRLSPPPKVTKIDLPGASNFPSNMLSQISHPDSIPETVLKRKVAPRASVGSSAAEPGSEFKRQRTATKDVDKRALRFRKFLIQKRTQSSAPEQSTPP